MPQWNCSCRVCQAVRGGKIPARTQSSVGIQDREGNWFLVNASPDLRFQIEASPALQPKPTPARNTSIAGILLTNADLDHVLGLLSLREGGPLTIFATSTVRATLESGLGVNRVLEAFCGLVWRVPSEKMARLGSTAEADLLFRAIYLPGTSPLYDSPTQTGGAHNVAYQFTDRSTGKRLLIAPDVAASTPTFQAALANSDAILLDGTFWSNEELPGIRSSARTATEMGHATIRDDSLSWLRGSPARRKIYIHINNTNPILLHDSPERLLVEAAGVEVGYDGIEFEV